MIKFETENQHSVYFYDCGELAKYLNLKHDNKSIGKNKMIELLRFNGYVMRDSNQPKQSMVTMEIMRYHLVNRRYKKYGMLLVSERGLNYFKRKVDTSDIQIGFQKKINKNNFVKLEDIV